MIPQIKQTLKNTIQTIKPFKWSVLWYFLCLFVLVLAYFDPPAKDDPILGYEYSKGAWNYINQEVYIGTFRLHLTIVILIFLLGLSNMKNHPKLARFILLYPWIFIAFGSVCILFNLLISLLIQG